MKTIITIGFCIAVVGVVLFLFYRHSRTLGDTEIRQMITGSWTGENPKFVMTISPDGSFTHGTSPSHDDIAGVWLIKDGFIVMTTTKSPQNNALAGGVVRSRVLNLDSHRLSLSHDKSGETMTLTR
jgi:hypothetical protein